MVRIKHKSNIKRAGSSAPITLILITVTMLAITNSLATNSLVSISKLRYEDSFYRKCVLSAIHEVVEYLYSSDPGSSATIVFNMPSGEITFTSNSIFFDGVDALDLQDQYSILKSVSSNEIVYEVKKISFTPATISPGLSRVVLSVDVTGKHKSISIGVEKP